MTIKKKINSNAGFSLIEVLFSTALFTIGILGVVSLINQSMADSMNRRNETIAGQLAQEGLELVRNIRDNNWLSGAASAFVGIQSGRIDYKHADNVENSTDYNLQLNGNGLYERGSEELFKRRIIVAADGSDKKITSEVTWGGDMPDSDENHCNPVTKCFYTEVTLSGTWGAH